MKSLIGQSLMAQVLDGAVDSTCRKDYSQLVARMSKTHTDKKIRNKFTIEYIMSKFTTMKLKLAQSRFKEKLKHESDGLTLLEFVELMKVIVPYNEKFEEYDFVNGLCFLFNEVDINGDGTMEWDELVSFVIEAVDSHHLQS